MSNSFVKDIQEFNVKYALPYAAKPQFLNDAAWEGFRINFLYEELSELETAFEKAQLDQVLDALVDIVYVAIGTAVSMGLPFEAAWKVVHESNMLKIKVERAEESKRQSVFDIVKPEGWQPPNLQKVIAEAVSGQTD